MPQPVATGLLPDYAIAGGIASHAETVDRTLFNPTRRPAPVAVAEAAKPRIQRGQYALTGTTVAGERSLAFLKEAKGGKARTVKQGDTINGMLVAEVKPDRVKLTLGDESEEIIAARSSTNPTPDAAAGRARPAPAPAAPGAAAHLAGQPQPQPPRPRRRNAAQTLAERRRAARAAAGRAGSRSGGRRRRAAGAAPRAAPAPAAPAQPAAQAVPDADADPGWAQVYQRYQQRRAQ